MPTHKHLTGLDVSRHRYGDPPLVDDGYPGLRLSALKPLKDGAKRGSWIYRYRTRAGELRQIKLGQYPGMGLADARKAWGEQKKIRDDPSRGDPRAELADVIEARRRAEATARQAKYTVMRLCEDYLVEHIDKVRKRTAEPRRLLEREVIPSLGSKAAVEVERRHVHEVVQGVLQRGAERVAAMMLIELRAAFEHAISAGRLPEDHPNPCDKVKGPTQRKRERSFTETELEQFLAWLPAAKVSRSVRDAMTLELLTTARQGEIVQMEWRHVDRERAVWHQPTSKNRRAHDVMLSRQAMEIVGAREGLAMRWVFPRPDGRGHIDSKAVGIQQYEAKKQGLGFTDWTTHDLRRSALTGLARLGCPRVVQDRIANHFDKSIAAIYDRHSYDDEARAWLQKWADHLDSIKPKASEGSPGAPAQTDPSGRGKPTGR